MSVRRTRHGFSLLEIMIAMGLIFLLLGLAGLLVKDTAAVLKRSAPHERFLQVVELGLRRVVSEVGSAEQLLAPASGTSAFLVLTQIENVPSNGRLPNPIPDPVPVFWDPASPTSVITYQVDSGVLKRQEVSPTLGLLNDVVARGLAGMSVERLDPQWARITMTVQVNEKLETVSQEARIWLDPP